VSKRAPTTSVLTANRLQDGIVVFLAAGGSWSDGIEAAAVARTPQEAQALEAQGAHDAARNLVVEPYLAEVRAVGGRLVPVRARERVRVDGPSVLGDVPGYEAPASPRASSPSPRERGEGRGLPSAKAEVEGQPKAPTSLEAAPHPNPPPASGERGREAA
jgi:hypothetical protein